MSEWRDIATAPKDGTPVDLWVIDAHDAVPENNHRIPNAVFMDAHWRHDNGADAFARVERWGWRATHWMPIPDPPVIK